MKKTESDQLEFIVPLKDLLEAGCHFGHQAKRWNPKMSPYLYTIRDGVHIFDLAQTSKLLADACKAGKQLVAEGGTIVFVGTKRQSQAIVKEEAQKVGAGFITTRWLGGLVSNWSQIDKSIGKLIDMRQKKEAGEYKKYTKKENLLLDREIARLDRFFGGLIGLKKIPDALFIVDSHRELTAIREARPAGVKIFAITDSNADPVVVDYPIPANDDAVRSITLIVSTFAKAVAQGMVLREKSKVKITNENKSN